jgi:ribosomal protein S18 acetylase RimI-like enzyme
VGGRGLPARGPLRARGRPRHRPGPRAARAAVEQARTRGCRRLELDVNDNNDAALALYRSVGFDNRDDRYGGGNLFMRLHL